MSNCAICDGTYDEKVRTGKAGSVIPVCGKHKGGRAIANPPKISTEELMEINSGRAKYTKQVFVAATTELLERIKS